MTSSTAQAGANALLKEIRQTIASDGPIPVAQYMALCLAHPVHGYYRNSEAIGADGDFVTAPEISQIFGELLGIWVIATWQQMGEPSEINLVELGPGRGTMMRDVLRALGVVPGLIDSVQVTLVEISTHLREVQKATLADHRGRLHWITSLEELANVTGGVPTLILANEFFDALPVTQHVCDNDEWVERKVAVTTDGNLAFEPAKGAMRETRRGALCSGPSSLQAALSAILHSRPTALLAIDYGYEGPATGDTLQAMQAHTYVDVLTAPGEHDITAHVDFAELTEVLGEAGFVTQGPISQADFLANLGFGPRLERLMQGKTAVEANGIETAAHRLVAEPGMGAHFRVLGAHGRDIPALIPFPPSSDE